jgi:undecaprenyl-diphosphatase
LRSIAPAVQGFTVNRVPADTGARRLLVAALAALAAFLALAAAVHAGITRPLDEAALRAAAALRAPLLDRIMLDATALGDTAVAFVLVAFVAIVLRATSRPTAAWLLWIALLGGSLLNDVAKEAFGRERPRVVPWLADVSSPAFPSGHAMRAIVVYVTLAWLVTRLDGTPTLRRAAWILALAVTLAVGASRVHLGVHYPSDVLGGFLLGGAWILLVAYAERVVRARRRR